MGRLRMSVYSHTSNLVLVFDDQKINGWRAARDQQEQWWNNGKTDVTYALRSPVEIAQVARDVIVTFQRLASTLTAADGAKKTTNLNATSIWRKEPSGWKIVIAHESFVE
jgi:ketosteroid isomerase-like protein